MLIFPTIHHPDMLTRPPATRLLLGRLLVRVPLRFDFVRLPSPSSAPNPPRPPSSSFAARSSCASAAMATSAPSLDDGTVAARGRRAMMAA